MKQLCENPQNRNKKFLRDGQTDLRTHPLIEMQGKKPQPQSKMQKQLTEAKTSKIIHDEA